MAFKKYLALMFIFLIYISIVNAAQFDVEIVPITDKISIDDYAKFKIKVKNNLNLADSYRIYTSDFPTWDVRTEPLVNPITIDLAQGKEGSVDIIVDPLKINNIGTYAVNLNVRSKTLNELKSIALKVSILSTEGLIGGYAPTVVTSLGIPAKIDPREEVPIKIILSNKNRIDYPDLVIKIESKLIKDTITTKLGPNEEKTLELKVKLDDLTKPQKDSLIVSVFRENKSIINPITRQIEIEEYADKETVSSKKNFLVSKSNYKIISNNPDYSGKFRVETSLVGSIFTSEHPKAKVVEENGKKYFEWDVKLENNQMDIKVNQNTLPLFFVIVILIGLLLAYYALRSQLTIRKETSNLVKKEGGVSEISVILHIKNRGKGKIQDIEITESVPSLVAVERDISIGSLQPSKIMRHEKRKNTIVKWEINNLEPTEERVLSYRIKTKLSILGGFSLPATTAVFKYEEKTQTTVSSRLNVGE